MQDSAARASPMATRPPRTGSGGEGDVRVGTGALWRVEHGKHVLDSVEGHVRRLSSWQLQVSLFRAPRQEY
jgi:hypothetical protein